MPAPRRTRKIVILEEPTRTITSGRLTKEDEFPSSRELVQSSRPCSPSSCNRLIVEIQKSLHRAPGTDYELISFNPVPGETAVGRHIDWNGPGVIEKMIEILYLHRLSSRPRIGKISYAAFPSRPS